MKYILLVFHFIALLNATEIKYKSLMNVNRVCYAAAREGHIVDILSFVHISKKTPSPGVIFNVSYFVYFLQTCCTSHAPNYLYSDIHYIYL